MTEGMTGSLMGKRIVNTRAVHQAGDLDALLRARGALPLDYPCIAIAVPQDRAPLDAALRDLVAGRFDWLVLTSANTVAALEYRLSALGLALAEARFRIAAIGPATAQAAHGQLGLTIADLPDEYVAEALAEGLPIQPGARVLLPESALARPTLADRLTARGAAVTTVTAYQTVCGSGGVDLPRSAGATAGRCADLHQLVNRTMYFLERLAQEGGQTEAALRLCAACIGPKTAATARDCGFKTIITPSEHTMESLVATLDAHFERMTAGEQSHD